MPLWQLRMLFREDFVPSERAMEQQQWTVTRRLVGHSGAQRRWDRAYQLLLPAVTPHSGPAGGGAHPSRIRVHLRDGA